MCSTQFVLTWVFRPMTVVLIVFDAYVSRVISHSFVRTPRRRFVGAAVRVHTGKDGRVRQLCGPGITTLQGRAKKVHVQPQRAPSRVEKKKVVTPKCKLMW
jgi:hypothetical protein